MIDIFIILALILLNGVFAMAEISLISARKSSLRKDIISGSKAAQRAYDLAKEPDKFLSTVQIGITSIGILTGVYSGSVLDDDFANFIINYGVSAKYAHIIAQSSIVIVVTYITIIFGELLPKRIGMSMAEKMAKTLSFPMYCLSIIASPFVWLLAESTSLFFNILGINTAENKVTEEEIKIIIQEGQDDGVVQAVEKDIVDRVFLMGDMRVDSIMTHRRDVVWFDINATADKIKETFKREIYKVFPVADDDLDSVIGVVFLKDLIQSVDTENFNIKDIVKPAIFFYENKSVYKALEEFKKVDQSYAFICDEFGNFQGILTVKDIMEALVGYVANIVTEAEISKGANQGEWIINGQCPFHNFLTHFDIEHLYSNNKYNTMGGLILENLEHIPTTGEKVEWNNFTFEILEMTGVRIEKILVINRQFAQ